MKIMLGRHVTQIIARSRILNAMLTADEAEFKEFALTLDAAVKAHIPCMPEQLL